MGSDWSRVELAAALLRLYVVEKIKEEYSLPDHNILSRKPTRLASQSASWGKKRCDSTGERLKQSRRRKGFKGWSHLSCELACKWW